MISIQGVELNPNMIWVDRNSWVGVSQSVQRTLGGQLIVTARGLVGGQPVTLSSIEDQGWLTSEQVNAVQALADIPGGIFDLDINGMVRKVMFRHEESPAFVTTPLIPRLEPQPGDYFICTIKLMFI